MNDDHDKNTAIVHIKCINTGFNNSDALTQYQYVIEADRTILRNARGN
ncbi:hypothetical protein SAMN04488696_0815 [Methanolobus profundi]|uniref:Uncharacterized protein n=1 Tax=Methanolobus profundi TaxID=487685 RepID=A0A1I4PQC6_9EURY|nr:hypothetical protein SAMN04488696_0815 [Methanolobus profundi]